jgi:hypothetical protein
MNRAFAGVLAFATASFPLLLTTSIAAAPTLTIHPAHAYAELVPLEILPPEPPKTISVNERIDEIAPLFGVSATVMKKVVACESNFDTHAVGDGGKSIGLVQINLSAHKDITRAEAEDPDFALSYLADNLAKGNANIWTCYREMYN